MTDPKPQAAKVDDAVWYARGLRFSCTHCNQCCTGPPGYVWVKREEIIQIADFLSLSVRDFADQYCRRVWSRISLKERPNGDCVFLTARGCRIYPVRPTQCNTFPFWEQNLRDRECWEALKRRCPGVGREKLYTRDEIERMAAGEGST